MKLGDWRGLIDGLIEAVLIVDAIDLKIADANRAACKLTGLAREALVGRSIIDFAATPEDACFWEDAAAGHEEGIFSESLLRRANGEFVQVDRSVSKIRLGGAGTVFVVGLRDQSQQRKVEDELEKLVAELRATLESTADGILVADLDDAIRGYNNRFADLWQLPHELLTQRNDAAVFDWLLQAVVDRDIYLDRIAIIRRSPLLESTDIIVLRSGKVLERVTMPQYARGRPIGRVYSYRDITQRLADEARLQLGVKVFDASLDAIFILDSGYSILAANPSCARLTEGAVDSLIGRSIEELIYDAEEVNLFDDMVAAVREIGFWEAEGWYRRASGSGAPGLISAVKVVEAAPSNRQTAHCIVFIKDLSERFAARKRIDELAYSDALTGLPNRILLHERLQYALDLATRESRPLAVAFIDLDRFKQINDSLGHMFGDRVLVEVAQRIKGCLRQADTAARLGGDEFVLLLHDADARGAETTARRIFEALAEPVFLDDMRFAISCSIGIALFPDDGNTIDELIKNADTAMYGAKERGRSGFRFFQRQMNIDLLSRMKLEHAMRAGLEQDAFRLHYQPQIELKSGRMIGVEALLRWSDPDLGEIPPGKFIPVAEESGFITVLGLWVLRTAVRQARQWMDEGLDLVVAVNVSALQFQLPDFVDTVRAALAEAGLPAKRLVLELTESILVRDAEEALERLQALAALGVSTSIDDFGTGYSSLTYLKKFPIQKLKIDRSFVQGLPSDESDAAIARAIINLGRALNMTTIAEGVETTRQHEFLSLAGCGEFQGFLCTPALPAADLRERYLSGKGYWQNAVSATE